MECKAKKMNINRTQLYKSFFNDLYHYHYKTGTLMIAIVIIVVWLNYILSDSIWEITEPLCYSIITTLNNILLSIVAAYFFYIYNVVYKDFKNDCYSFGYYYIKIYNKTKDLKYFTENVLNNDLSLYKETNPDYIVNKLTNKKNNDKIEFDILLYEKMQMYLKRLERFVETLDSYSHNRYINTSILAQTIHGDDALRYSSVDNKNYCNYDDLYTYSGIFQRKMDILLTYVESLESTYKKMFRGYGVY